MQDAGTHAERLKQAEASRCRVGCPLPITPDVTLDGILSPTNLSEPAPHVAPHQKTVYQQLKIGAVDWQDEQERWHKQVTWGRESPEEFVKTLYRLACRCGYEQAAEKIFAADGARRGRFVRHGIYFRDVSQYRSSAAQPSAVLVWSRHIFSAATAVLDWYHASEHLWDAARVANPAEAKSWSAPATTEPARTAIEKLIGSVGERVDRMDYPTYRQRGWQIGTGMIESTCKQVVGQRLKGPGMHWRESGTLAMTALKATELNGDWHRFWNFLVLCA